MSQEHSLKKSTKLSFESISAQHGSAATLRTLCFNIPSFDSRAALCLKKCFNLDPYDNVCFCTTPSAVVPLTSLCLVTNLILCLTFFYLIPAVKQTLAPGVKAVQVVSQSPLTAVQKNKLKEAGGETFRFVTHQDKFYHCV